MLHINKASKQFGATLILNQIELTIKSSAVVGLAGPSGSGKSTLLRCIQQLETLDEGSIHCAAKTGFMFQDFQLFPHMTVLKNLTYAPSLHNKGQTYEKEALSLLSSLGIADKAQALPQQLSGGQKQRVALARSLMMQPGLLLCDEPTSGLDLATIDEVITLLNSIRALGVTMLIASHDLDFLSKIADRLIVLNKGIIVADVNPKTVTNPSQELKQYY